MSLPCCSWFGRVPLGNAQPHLGDHWVLSASTRATPETAESLSCQPDFERGFIEAEVVSFEDLDATGSMAEAKAKGKVRIEGKDYVMQDGDVVEFRTGLTSGSKK